MRSLITTLLFLCILFLSANKLSADESDLYFLSHPAPSPDGTSVVFSFEGDIWKVSLSGGQATRLTAMTGQETHPRFSPDGRYIAFSGEQDGNRSVYKMNTSGGDITRLTWHDGSNLVNSWSWDSERIRFSSDRYNYIDAYEVDISGSTPRRLFNSHFFNLPHDIAQHPETGDFFFTDTWESFRFPERKGYRGPFNPVIRSYNPETDEYREHTEHEGKNMWPSADQNGTVYYASDQYNNEYNLFRIRNGEPEQLTRFDESIRYPQVSADGSVVVFEKGYQIWVYDVETESSRHISVSLNRNPVLGLPVSFSTAGSVTGFDISPDNKKLAFISRGELFVSDTEGKYVRQMSTNPAERVSEVVWLDDNELLYTQTWNGYHNLYTIRAEAHSQERNLTQLRMHHRNLTPSPERDQIAYFRGRTDVMIFDKARVRSRQVHQDELWSFSNQSLHWSPDGRLLAFNAMRFFERDILVYDTSSEDVLNLTRTGVSENSPFFSPDGSFLYFSTDRIRPVYPRGSTEADIYRMALTPQPPDLRLNRFDTLFDESDEDDENDEAAPETRIEKENLHKRWERIASNRGMQTGPYVIQDGDDHIVIYGSSHDGSGANLWKTVLSPFDPPETSKIEGARTMSTDIRKAGDSYYLMIGGNIHTLDPNAGSVSQIEISHRFTRNLRDEFNQIFYETWANLEENFYDEDFHGRDWNAVREYYGQFLPGLNSRSNLRRLTNDMLGELNASHMGFASFGAEEQPYYRSSTQATGILFKNDDGFNVERILPGSNADKAGLNDEIQFDDVLRAVNGVRVNLEGNREKYFSSPDAGDEIELTFMRGRAEYTVRLKTQTSASLRELLYDEWMEQRQQKTDELGDRSIAYIHMKNMGSGELNRFKEELARQFVHREGLILDLRYNRGGNVHDEVIQTLSRKSYLKWQYRSGTPTGQPNFAPADYPIVVLINEQSLSDAEMTTAGLRELGIGTLMGMPTYRWIIFTSGISLVDGSFHRLPAWGVYTFEGDNLEQTGVEPDIRVRNTFLDNLRNNDPQLERAVEYILEQRTRE